MAHVVGNWPNRCTVWAIDDAKTNNIEALAAASRSTQIHEKR